MVQAFAARGMGQYVLTVRREGEEDEERDGGRMRMSEDKKKKRAKI